MIRKPNLLLDLEDVARQFSVKVIYDQFFGQGGFCRVKDKSYIILNNSLSTETKIALFLEGLKNFPLTNIQLPPKIKNLIEEEKV